jgi:hypothetical protein
MMGADFRGSRMTVQEALSYLLTNLVVERRLTIRLTPSSLFELMSLASEAADEINAGNGVIPHEIIEGYARRFAQATHGAGP